jgi:hypothetical protein
MSFFFRGGEGEIRTHEGCETLPVFKTGAFNRSATSPICPAQRVVTILPDKTLARFGAKPLNPRALPPIYAATGQNLRPPMGGAKMAYLVLPEDFDGYVSRQ